MIQACYEIWDDRQPRPSIALIPMWLPLRSLSYKEDKGRTSHARSGSRLMSPGGAPVRLDRFSFNFMGTLGAILGPAFEFRERAIIKMFALSWTAKQERESLMRVVDSVFFPPCHPRGCECKCPSEPGKGMRVVDDFHYCEESKTYRIVLSEEFMEEVKGGAPAPIEHLIRLSPSFAAMDIFMWMVLRAHDRCRGPVQLNGEGGLLQMFSGADREAKGKQNLLEWLDKIEDRAWKHPPYKFDPQAETMKCVAPGNPRDALAKFLKVDDLDTVWDSLRARHRKRWPELERRQAARGMRAVRAVTRSAVRSAPSSAAMAGATAPAELGESATATNDSERAGPTQVTGSPRDDAAGGDGSLFAGLSRSLGVPPGSSQGLEMAVTRIMADQLTQRALGFLALQLCNLAQPSATTAPPGASAPEAPPAVATRPDGKPPDATPPIGEPPHAGPPDDKPPDDKPPDDKPPDDKPPDDKPPDGEPPGARPPGVKPPDAARSDVGPASAKPPDAGPPSANAPDAAQPNDEPSHARLPGADLPDAEPSNGIRPNGKPPTGKRPDGKPPTGKRPDGKPPTGKPRDTGPPDGTRPNAEASSAESPGEQSEGDTS